MSLRLVLVMALATSGCFVDRAGLARPRSDAGARDAGAGDAGTSDAGADDAGLDASFDAGVDAGFDAGPPSCDALYGAAPGYVLCHERATECEFRAQLDTVRSCTSTCASLDGRCLSAFRNEDIVDLCIRSVSVSCDGMQIDNICVCSRGP